MAYDLAQALDALAALTSEGPTTTDDLMNLVRQVSVEASGSTTVFYSGSMPGSSYDASDVVKKMLESGEDIRVVGKSPAGEFLRSIEFESAVADIFNTSVADLYESGTPSANWLGSTSTADGPWAEISKRFAAATEGDVRFIGPVEKEKGTHLFLRREGDYHAKEGKSVGTKLPSPHSTGGKREAGQ